MAGEWRSSTIGELCDTGVVELQTGPFGTQLHAHDYVKDGVPVVPTEAIRNRQIDHSVLPKISPGKAAELARHRLELDDILFARRGVQATGHIGYVREAEYGFLCGTGAIRLRVRRGGSSVNPDFLSHVLANPASVEWFKFHAIGATMPNLNEGIIRSFPLQIPPMPEQRAIAHILGTLDDKIELNRRMNETLEAMVRALFKSWFVDFLPVRANMEVRNRKARTQTGDPVRAKAAGRDPGLPKLLADLFPDSFQDSELGEIPRGWEVGSIYIATEVIYGAPFASAKFNFDGIGKPLIRIRDLAGESPGVYTAEEHPKGYLVKPGDIVVGMDGEFRAYLWGGVESWLNQRVSGFKPRAGFSSPFVLHSIVGLLAGVEATETATTVIHLGKNDIDRFKIIVPTELILTNFGRLAGPLFECIVVNKQESRTLAALRYTLLPKLISGELRINIDEPYVEEATR
jgi:type I restriction enzyme, S subunit